MSDADVDADVDEAAIEPEVWPRVVKLRHPIDYGKERITSLEFRRGRMGDIKGMKLERAVPVDHLVLLASRLSNRPVPLIELLDIDDAGEVMDIALDFFMRCLAAGKSRSES